MTSSVKLASQILLNQYWVLTGDFALHTRDEWIAILTSHGAVIGKKVDKQTSYLLQGAGAVYSSKTLGAQELDITCVNEFELSSKIGCYKQTEDYTVGTTLKFY